MQNNKFNKHAFLAGNQTQQIQALPRDLIIAIRDVYEPAGMEVTTKPQCEIESSDYGACRFSLNKHNIVFRVAKTTPTKIGQFVTIWKRPKSTSEIEPFDVSDGMSFIIVSVFDESHRGQFVFNQEVLISMGIMSCNGKGGKLAFRVYPPWTKPVAKAAIKTQRWQLQYFLPVVEGSAADPALVHKLLTPETFEPQCK